MSRLADRPRHPPYESYPSSRSPSQPPASSERTPLLGDIERRISSRSRSRETHAGVEDVAGDQDEDEAPEPGEALGLLQGDVRFDEEEHEDDVPRLEAGRGGDKKRTLGVLRTRSKYYVPVLEWAPKYSLSLFSGDVVAGVTLACLLIPQGISYASQLGQLSPISGLYCAAVPAMVYAMLGTCRQLSIGPEAALSLLVGGIITEIIAETDHDPHRPLSQPAKTKIGIEVATGMGLQIGVITLALGLFRLGFLDVVLSRALLRGFITAVGVLICIEQMIGMLGLAPLLSSIHSRPSTSVEKASFLLSHIQDTHKLTAMIAFSTLAFLIIARSTKKILKGSKGFSWLKFVPEVLVAVIITTYSASRFGWDEAGLLVLGKIEGLGGEVGAIGFPLRHQTLRHFSRTLPTSFVISIIGYVDSIIAAKENSDKYGYSISPNRELVALGAANVALSFFPGCVPGFGSVTRSRLNGEFGCRTQMAGFVSALSIFFAIAFLLPALFFLPKCVLSAIVLLVVWGILIEAPHEIMFYVKVAAWKDMAQMTLTFLLTLFVGVETGLIASVAFSLILVVQNSTQTRIKILGHLEGGHEWVPVDENPEAKEDVPGVLVIRIREALNFANTGQLKERLRRLELYGPGKAHPSEAPRRDAASVVVIHMSEVESIDASAIAIFSELADAYGARGVRIFFTHLRPEQKELFDKAGLIDKLGPEAFQDDVSRAMQVIEDQNLGSCASSR